MGVHTLLPPPDTSLRDAALTPERFAACLSTDMEAGNVWGSDAATRWPMSFRMQRYRDGMLKDWLDWLSPEKSGSKVVGEERLGYPIPDRSIDLSAAMHAHVWETVQGAPYDASRYRHVDFHNATDYYFQTLLGPATRVLDFGAGYGRQSFLWTRENESIAYVAVEGIEGPYLMQNRVFKALSDVDVHEYVDDPIRFRIHPAGHGEKRIHHLPTWRMDLLPDRFFDLIICTQVLQELDGAIVQPLLDEFQRVAAPGGRLYIRDHEYYRPAHDVAIGRRLLADGWRLAFRYPGIDKHDIHGIPRVWRRTNEDTRELMSVRTRFRRRLWLSAPWTRFFDDTRSRRHGLLRRGLWHHLRHGRPRRSDLFDRFLPI